MAYRYFIELSYNGKNYHGWQVQPNATSVQSVLNNALSLILKCKIETIGAGRTDTGVHAKFFTAHIDVPETLIELDSIVFRLNCFLPADICIKKIFRVNDSMHARFSALSRTYEYHITTCKNPFVTDFAYFFHKQLDVELMNEAAQVLSYYTDFTSFSKVHTDTKTNNCKIMFAHWVIDGDGLLVFTIKADRFLRNMVRAIVGTLLDVGTKKISLQEFCNIIETKDRCQAGQSVPSHGLFLTEIEYPETIYL